MPSEWETNLSSSSSAKVSSSSASSLSASSSTATSPEPNLNGNNSGNNESAKNGHGKDCALKSTMSYDPTAYVARARVTRPTPPKPSCNPMQFVQIKPCNLYQSAQQQLKKAEEIKKVKEVKKEDPEDWQNNLDNWKSSRRKRVEHIIDRVVEVKKLEQEEHDRMRRKSKTFSEMMEERGERSRGRSKLQSLASYNEEEANDFSDLGIGTSSASGKSSISEDCEVHSIVSEPAEVDNLSSFDIESNSCPPCHDERNRDRISSPGYETSSTAPVTSPDPQPHEYTYEGAIEDYKSRVSKASASSIYKKSTIGDSSITRSLIFERRQPSVDSDNDAESTIPTVKKEDLPKIDISKKRELFEKPDMTKSLTTPTSVAQTQNHDQIEKKRIASELTNVRSIKDRLSSLEKKPEPVDESTTGILSGEIASVKERLQCLEQQKQQNSVSPKPNTNKVIAEVVAVPPLKDRLSSLQNAVTKEEVHKKPVVLVDEYQLEMLKNEEFARRQLDTTKDDSVVEKAPSDDSGINTTDEKIDHDPTTTEDEDDIVEVDRRTQLVTPEDKVPPSACSNEFHGEFDSSVSLLQLKNLNPPTVVSLVDKPVVVDVGGGGGNVRTLLNSSKVVPSAENSDVNHAQNLLKMFKMAFDTDDDDGGDDVSGALEQIMSAPVKEAVEISSREKDRERIGVVVQKNKETVVPWRRKAEVTESVVKASRIPMGSPAVRDSEAVLKRLPVKDSVSVDDGAKKSSKTPQCISDTSKAPVSSPNADLAIDTTSQRASDLIAAFRKQIENEPKCSVKVLAHRSPVPQKRYGTTTSSEASIAPMTPPVNASHKVKPIDSDLNLILNIDNSQKALEKKSMIPVSSKIQPMSPVSSSDPPKIDIPSPASPLATSPKTSSPLSHSALSPTIPSPVSPRSSPSAAVGALTSPIYENIPFETDISRPSSGVDLRKVSSPDIGGRVEIFNSKSMPPKPKSPQALPRTVKSFPTDEFKPEVQSEQFQQSARNEFLKDLTSCQPKIVGQQPKPSLEADSEVVNQESVIKVRELPSAALGKVAECPQKTAETPKSPESGKPSLKGDPLPFDNCVDILKSFLNAERSLYPTKDIVSHKKITSPSDTSDAFLRQESVIEVPCTKIDVKDLPDPNFIRTPCLNVDVNEKVYRDSMKAPEAPVRDSISSAGDSSPSSEITVIFKPKTTPIPGSPPTPNKSTLMEIANRMGSPIAARRTPQSPPPVEEKPYLKLNVKDLPDPNFIRTPCIEVKKETLSECMTSRPTPPSSPKLRLHKTNVEMLKQTCDEVSNSPPLSPVLESPSAEKPNLLIARVEVVETKIKVTTTNDNESPPPMPSSPPPPAPLPGSPKAKPKFPITSKPKNIFEFLKKNFQSKPESAAGSGSNEFTPISVDNSKFYVPSNATESPANNGVNIEITKTITTDAIVEQTDSDLTSEINEMLDEELSKLVVEDAKL